MNDLPTPCASQKNDAEKSVDYYFDLVCKYAPVIKKSLADNGSRSIADYVNSYSLPQEPGYQKKDDLFEKVYEYLSPLQGTAIANQVVQDLTDTPWALTANHHGVDFFAQSVQSSLLFSLILSSQIPRASTIPIFACGNIPLNNLTYPRGMLLYHGTDNTLEDIPQKIPVFSDKVKHSTVSVTEPIDKTQLRRASKRVNQMVQQGTISTGFSDIIQDIFEKEYADPHVQGLKNYSAQSVVLNQRIWKRLYSNSQTAMNMVYMELETIVGKLLEIDLYNPQSLISLLMFNPAVRNALMEDLDGRSACWQADKLRKRIKGDFTAGATKKQFVNCGTHFFWGVDNKKKLIPMYLDSQGANHILLRGKDDRGKGYSIPFDPCTIGEALKQKYLMPSLFTCYATLSFARGINCIGGYYQSEYLPVMQKKVVNVLKKTATLEDVAVQIEKVNTASYLSGMQMVMTGDADHGLIPAGPVEIIAGGGLDLKHIEQLRRLTIKQAHLASLFETLPDVVPYGARKNGWKQDISKLCLQLLREKAVVI